MIYPELEKVRELAGGGEYKRIPVSTEIYSDSRTPIEVLRIIKRITKHCYILESVEDRTNWGRYTFLGYDPTLEITCRHGHLKMHCCGTEFSEDTNDPAKYIRKILADNKSPKIAGLPPFTGGLVGYFSYEYLGYSEPSLDLEAEDEEKFNDVDLMLFENVIAFDNYRQKIVLIANIRVDDPNELSNEYEKGIMALRAGAGIIGVNNRDLKTFTVDTGRSIALRKLVPDDILFISESGIRDAEQIKTLADNKVDAVLIGETLMRASDKKKMLGELSGKIGDEMP
jgi:Indole-3-glycerol phosphate synthase